MNICVIICTYNRAQNLPECFEHLQRQENDDNVSWEILLVDNNSDDDTRLVTERYRNNSSLKIRYTLEQQQGLSFARNRGIREANARLIVFIDDDIRVRPQWLRSISRTFSNYHCDAVGGRIHIHAPATLPKWISPDMYGFLGHQDYGNEPRVLNGTSEFPFGGNMAIHERVFDKIGMFNTELGRKGKGRKKDELFKGEETDFFHRLSTAGGVMRYQPDAVVIHKIEPHQLKKGFFLTLHNNAGILKSRQDTNIYARTLFGVPRFVFTQFLHSIWKYLVQTATKGSDFSFRQLMNVVYFLGMISGYHQNSAVK